MPRNTFDILSQLVERVSCKPGWAFYLIDADTGNVVENAKTAVHLTLVISISCRDTYDHAGATSRIAHYFPVPWATYNDKSWRRWIFECCRKVEDHELGEWFTVMSELLGTESERPFAPLHGPGEDPTTIHEFRNEKDARILQDGSVTTTDITGLMTPTAHLETELRDWVNTADREGVYTLTREEVLELLSESSVKKTS